MTFLDLAGAAIIPVTLIPVLSPVCHRSWPGSRRGAGMATFVLVHGGGHGGWCYQRVSRLLSRAGHEVHAPTMTGVGERAHLVGPDVDLSLHVQDIAAV